MRPLAFTVLLIAVGSAGPSTAGVADLNENSEADFVATFTRFCVDRPANINEFAAQLDAEKGLQKLDFPTDFLPRLKEADVRRAWTYSSDQINYQLILVHTPAWHNSDIRCAVRIIKQGNILAYYDLFKAAMKAKGLSLRETRLPHYLRMSGRISDGRYGEALLSSRGVVPAEPQRDNITLTIRFGE
jgi:hypothetical protein